MLTKDITMVVLYLCCWDFFESDISKLSYILQKSCDVNAVDKCGRTALNYVFAGETKCIDDEYVNVLIDAGADYLIKDDFHKTTFKYMFTFIKNSKKSVYVTFSINMDSYLLMKMKMFYYPDITG